MYCEIMRHETPSDVMHSVTLKCLKSTMYGQVYVLLKTEWIDFEAEIGKWNS